MKVDFHVHTSVGGGKNTPAEMAAVAKKRGLDAIAITDTGTLKGWEHFHPQSFVIIPGVELELEEGRVLVYGVTKVPAHRTVEGLLKWVKEGGYLAVPVLGGPIPDWAMQFEVVEAINASAPPWVCKAAVKRCTSTGKKFLCNSGARSVSQLGKFYNNVDAEGDWEDIVKAVKKGRFEPRLKFPGLGDLLRSRF